MIDTQDMPLNNVIQISLDMIDKPSAILKRQQLKKGSKPNTIIDLKKLGGQTADIDTLLLRSNQ